ncbi:MAG: YqeG family HAD IIIA-type phosphatase [Coriobacteriales bacterium]|nr:YqeG family HAD IIIA-type phosphatase [Coriobacteriales bacterium]
MKTYAWYEPVEDVSCIDLDVLWDAGKRGLLIDRDNTVVPRDTKEIPQSAIDWIKAAEEKGFKICLVSNNWKKNVLKDAEKLGCSLVSRAAKPLPFSLWHALNKLGIKREEAVLIGDQVFTDILGAKLAGITPILVQPQTTVDLAYTAFLRKYERALIEKVAAKHREQ